MLLRATSDVRSRGRGPIELVGKRNGWRTMRTNQRIYKVGGGHITVKSDATLRFTDVGYQFGGAYWKVHQLARFDLRPVLPDGSFGDPVRTSPKLNYCLRDLERTQPSAVSPPLATTPAATRTPTATGSRSGPRSAGRTSTPPPTTSSGSTSPGCAAASPSR